jgi:hypothetical protein
MKKRNNISRKATKINSKSSIKLAFLIALIGVFTTFSAKNAAFAQENYPVGVGINLSGKMGINAADVPQGWQNNVAVLKGIDVGIFGFMPMANDSRTGIVLELAYTNMPFNLKSYDYGDITELNTKFITLSPYLLFSGFTVGVDIGFNLDNEIENGSALLLPYDNDLNVNVRVGGMIPIHQSDLGVFNFIANATYSLTGSNYAGGGFTYNPATLSLGLSYLFNLEKFAE